MKAFLFEATQYLPRPRSEVFDFFSDACNLEAITPPWLRFQILTPAPIRMGVGTLIDYRLRVHGLPLRWRTRIAEWNPPHGFADEQVRGPYRLWHHEHTFEEADGGTLMRDSIRYAPMGGTLINRLFVRRDVEAIFAYRERRLKELFASGVFTAN
ncbi:MAG: SRPBCC family protein [Verrucomicrobia bacterium]|jgi:ligand-binding SRPBCC domain-containing protein|nr:SRPBCC family protein [Verrucomicrobiota bacterium]